MKFIENINESKNLENIVNISISILNLFFLIFSPLLGYFLSIAYLLLFSNYISKNFRIINVIFLLIDISIISASRLYFSVESDDFIRYYQTYTQLLNGDFSCITTPRYSNGLEWVLPIFYAILAKLTSIKSPEFVLFSETLLFVVIFYIWIENYFKNVLSNYEINKLVATAFLFLSISSITLYTRQYIAMVILLFSFYGSLKKRLFFLFMAISTHLTALPIFIFIKLIQKFKLKALIPFSLILFLFVNYFNVILNFFDLSLPLIGKLVYYTHEINVDNSLPINQLFFIVIINIGLYINKKNNSFLRDWRLVFLFFSIIFIIFLPIPLMSMRLTILLIAIMLGVFFYFAYSDFGIFYNFFLMLYLVYRLTSGLLTNVSYPMHFWHNYNWIGKIYYYILN